ncbi:hypothetical protein CPB85DRAFT_1327537 [Mucidula mucida]|nr:hypothetical protein CPB85DRAFT_1327537 [Mucidula mucida]
MTGISICITRSTTLPLRLADLHVFSACLLFRLNRNPGKLAAVTFPLFCTAYRSRCWK